MKFSTIVWIAILFISIVLFLGKLQNYNCKAEYLRGYTDYQIDTYIPAPYLPDPSIEIEIPIKTVNPDLKEKFRG
jgi:hypothetical protein